MAKRVTGDTDTTLKRFKKIPVYVVEEHNDALQFIYSAIGGKKLPVEGTTLVHLDSHPDLLVSRTLSGEAARDGKRVLPLLDIENWILPAAAAGHLSRVVWLRPPWATQLADGTRTFRIGDNSDTGLVRVDCSETYFLSDALYSSRLKNERTLTLSVEELGDSDFDRKDEEKYVADTVKRLDITTPYVLDVDLDFFSTTNPFLDVYSQIGLYDRLQPLYEFDDPSSRTTEEVDRVVAKRDQQLDELQEIFVFLQKHRSLDNWKREKNQRFKIVSQLFDDLHRAYPDEEIDWELVHTAGCTRDHGGLPDHTSSPLEIDHLVKHSFRHLLRALPPPVLVTIARSSRDEYCPPHQVDQIQDMVLHELKQELNTDEPVLYYLDELI